MTHVSLAFLDLCYTCTINIITQISVNYKITILIDSY